MLFRDRTDAGRQLAERLALFRGRDDLLVLGLPRGGVPVACEVAAALGAPLDIFLARKLGVPGNEELAFGAVAAGGVRVLDRAMIRAGSISREQVARITATSLELTRARALLYRRGRPALPIAGKTVILVDDGVATGSSLLAAIQSIRQMGPGELVVAVPVAPCSTLTRLQREVQKLFAVDTPQNFQAVGQFYADFRQTSDEEVVELLERAATDQKHPEQGGESP